MECTKCGAELDFREAFCSKCGEVTPRGKEPKELVGQYSADVLSGIGKLFSAAFAFATDPANRKKVAIGAAVSAFLLIALTNNPISRGFGGMFTSTPDAPKLQEDGSPEFSSYEDVFLDEEAEYFITGSANVRNFPTSEGTTVLRTLDEGEIVVAREVTPFNPGTRWFKLTDGGYVWGNNIGIFEDQEEFGQLQFAQAIQGTWSTMNSCRGDSRPDEVLEIGASKIVDRGVTAQLEQIQQDPNGNDLYLMSYYAVGEILPATLRITTDASGFTLFIEDLEAPSEPQRTYFQAAAGCRPETRLP